MSVSVATQVQKLTRPLTLPIQVSSGFRTLFDCSDPGAEGIEACEPTGGTVLGQPLASTPRDEAETRPAIGRPKPERWEVFARSNIFAAADFGRMSEVEALEKAASDVLAELPLMVDRAVEAAAAHEEQPAL